MKRHYLLSLVAACVLALSSCGTMVPGITNPSSPVTSTATNVLGSLLSELIGNAIPVNEQSIQGTWTYSSPEVRFESESLLSKAGGEVAAAQIEEKLKEIYSQIGVEPGKTSFTFAEDKTCTIEIGGKKIKGNYTLDPSTSTINIVATAGLIKLNGKVYFGLNSLVILFDADKILSIAQTLSAISGNTNSSIGALSTALSQYKGLMLGMNLRK